MLLTVLLALVLTSVQKGELLQRLKASGWLTRSQAVRETLAVDGILADAQFQTAFINLLDKESRNPNLGGMLEFNGYEQYYTSVLEAVQKIASQYHNKVAWKALGESAYNDDSQFAKWLATQPEAYDTLVELTNSQNQFVRENALYVLAETCAIGKQHCEEVRSLLRQRGKTANMQTQPEVALSVLRGLGICGTVEDLSLIEQMSKESTSPDYQYFVRKAREQIEERTAHK